ncbi:hypothetical protein [Guyparkeria sp.]|uniref:hypothetical protein n=1 Tax=Guyparkeria sp. TaxID=2035736 RepID=UPI0039706CCB
MKSFAHFATTKAMGKGSTQVQHLVETEVPPRLLEEWLALWSEVNDLPGGLRVRLRPHSAGSELLELSVLRGDTVVAHVVFATIQDRRGKNILSIRDQETMDQSLRRKRSMTLLHLFLLHRYKVVSVHYVSPTDDNEAAATGMQSLGIFGEVNVEVGHIIVAEVNPERVRSLLNPKREELGKLISKS